MLLHFKPGDLSNQLRNKSIQAFESSCDQDEIIEQLKNKLYGYLCKAAELEHTLSMQYLFCAFSIKKYPEEFDNFNSSTESNQKIFSVLEKIRRWEAKILYVARQEMEHLNLVQNLLAILGKPPFFYRNNFPVTAVENPLGYPIELVPFGKYAMEVFRFWEKPDHLDLPYPVRQNETSLSNNSAIAGDSFNLDEGVNQSWNEILAVVEGEKLAGHNQVKESIEELYTCINVYFYFLLKYKLLRPDNVNRIVEEHFGFNITLEPIVEGKFLKYVNEVIDQILMEGEGVHGVPPSLDSHFMVYQEILDDMADLEQNDSALTAQFNLPVVENPVLPGVENYANNGLTVNNITNEVGGKAMELFNDAYLLLNQMLYWYFNDYSIDYTTGVRPPKTNAFFRTSFYPFMTMVIRPLGELVCRLPADKDYMPVKGKVPPRTAGPNFWLAAENNAALEKLFLKATTLEYFVEALGLMSEKASKLGKLCTVNGYNMANFNSEDARDFDVRFNYLAENFQRIAQNFSSYWKGEIVAPIPSKNFQNFSDQYN